MALAVVTPLVVTAIAVALMLLWLPELPVPAATHWSGAGVDSSGAALTFPAAMGGIGVVMTLVTAIVVLGGGRRSWVGSSRGAGAVVPAATVFLAITLTWCVGVQRGLASWTEVPNVAPALLVAVPVAVAVGVAAFLLLPPPVAA